jgi:RNA-directed DNA polymerase
MVYEISRLVPVHVCKLETLREAYQLAKANNGAPGVDGVTFEAIEASGVDAFLAEIQDALVIRTYRPMRLRQKAIPKEGGTKVRVLSIPTIRDRVVQGALKWSSRCSVSASARW